MEKPDSSDILRELSTIGAGNAAGALSKMIGKIVYINVPSAHWITIEEVTQAVEVHQPSISIIVQIDEKRPGYVLLLLEEEDSFSLLRFLMGADVDELGSMEESALRETGNILTGTFIGALSRFLNIEIMERPPLIRLDTVQTLFNEILGEQKVDERIWISTIKFAVEGECSKSYILFIPFSDFERYAVKRLF